MRKLFILIILILLLTSCSTKSNYEKYMESGKEALISEDFASAVKKFDMALIEKPTDKDANILLNRAKKSLTESNFILETNKIYKALLEIGSYKEDEISLISIEEAKDKINESSHLLESIKNLSVAWSQDTIAGEAYSGLNSAATSINEMFIAISEDISEPFVLKNKDYSMSERYQYSQTTRDSKTRSRISFTKYREGMDKYKYEINEFDK